MQNFEINRFHTNGESCLSAMPSKPSPTWRLMKSLAMRKGVVFLTAVCTAGCYRATVETGAQPSLQVIEKGWASSWIYGLVPPATVETAARCPYGVSKVVTELTFANQLVSFLTLGIYTPMSIKATCAAAVQAVADQQIVSPGARTPGDPPIISPPIREVPGQAEAPPQRICTQSDAMMGFCRREDVPGPPPSTPARREGFWIGFGFGYAAAGDDFGIDEWDAGVGGNFRIGGTLNRSTLIGFESNTWVDWEDSEVLAISHSGLSVSLYPAENAGLFVKLGGGVATISYFSEFGDDTESGFGALAGIGVDVPIGSRTSLTPGINYYHGWYDGASIGVFQAIVGFTFH